MILIAVDGIGGLAKRVVCYLWHALKETIKRIRLYANKHNSYVYTVYKKFVNGLLGH